MQLTSIYNSFAASLDTSLATIQNVSSSTTLSAADILTAAGAGCDRTGGLLKARFAANVNLTAELAASDSTSRHLLSTSCSATAVSVVSVTIMRCPMLPVGAPHRLHLQGWLHVTAPLPGPSVAGTLAQLSACTSLTIWQRSVCVCFLRAGQLQVDLGASGECLGLLVEAAWRSWRGASLPAVSIGCLQMQMKHLQRHFRTHPLRLQVTTYPNGSILVAANTSAVVTSSNATSNTSSADDVFGTQPLERYIGKAVLCSMHGHALSVQVQARQRCDRSP